MDATAMRHAVSHFGSGLTIVTGLDDAKPVGFTCQSFFSLSLNPALISFAPSRTSTTWPAIRPLKTFAVNILADHQAGHSTAFSRSGTDKFADIAWRLSDHGAPHLAESLAVFDCRLWAEYDGGDHTIVAAEVLDFHVGTEGGPLLYFKSAYASVNASFDSVAVRRSQPAQ
jgi:3-hydroxy-9,10-secoandrosta-1,3,5(10)-triene-9,17-dione monooxygenase reductase component